MNEVSLLSHPLVAAQPALSRRRKRNLRVRARGEWAARRARFVAAVSTYRGAPSNNRVACSPADMALKTRLKELVGDLP